MEPLKISYNDRTLFHMLRHFESINDTARTCLLDRGYKPGQIVTELMMLGSKFHVSFANDIKSLEKQLLNGIMKHSFTKNGYIHQCFEFDINLFPNGVGKLGMASIQDLKDKGFTSFEWKHNRGLELCHYFLNVMPSTNTLTVVLKPQKKYQLLITAFPGKVALPLPKKGMTDAFFQKCQQFWQEHAFLEMDDKDKRITS